MQRGKIWIHRENYALEHVKIISVLVGACVPHVSLEQNQNKMIEVGSMKEKIKSRIICEDQNFREFIWIKTKNYRDMQRGFFFDTQK